MVVVELFILTTTSAIAKQAVIIALLAIHKFSPGTIA
jgi:hypothetical protein